MKKIKILFLLSLFNFTMQSQSLKGYSLGDYHENGNGIFSKHTTVVLGVSVGGLEGNLHATTTSNYIIYDVSFSPSYKEYIDGILFHPTERFFNLPDVNTFLGDLEGNYDIKFVKHKEGDEFSLVWNYSCVKNNVKYNLRAQKKFSSEAYRIKFSMTRVDLEIKNEREKAIKRTKDF